MLTYLHTCTPPFVLFVWCAVHVWRRASRKIQVGRSTDNTDTCGAIETDRQAEKDRQTDRQGRHLGKCVVSVVSCVCGGVCGSVACGKGKSDQAWPTNPAALPWPGLV